jgi:hypothetical protein
MLSLAILFWRMPTTFTNPQFWGENAGFFFRAYSEHWHVLWTPVAGYLVWIQSFVAAAASFFPPAAAPSIYNYTAVLLTLATVWLSTSPRLDMPYKPLIAVAIAIVPMGFEELGTITNIQWVLPIGAFALLFMRAARSRITLAIEMAFAAAMAFSGPFSIFLAPLLCGKPPRRRTEQTGTGFWFLRLSSSREPRLRSSRSASMRIKPQTRLPLRPIRGCSGSLYR